LRIEAENRQREAESRLEDVTYEWETNKSSLLRTILDLQKQVEQQQLTTRNELEEKTDTIRKSEEETKRLRLKVEEMKSEIFYEKNLNEELNIRLGSFQHNLEEAERKLTLSEAERRKYAEMDDVMNNNANVDKSQSQGSDGGIENARREAGTPCQPGSDSLNQTSDYSLSSIESVETSKVRRKIKVRRSMSFDFANLALERTLIEPQMCLECVNTSVIGISKGESDSPKLPWCPHQKKAPGLLSVINSRNLPLSSTPITERLSRLINQSPGSANLFETSQKCFFSPMSSSTLLFKGHTTHHHVGLPQLQPAQQPQHEQQPHESSQSKQVPQLLQLQPPFLASTAPVISKSMLERKRD